MNRAHTLEEVVEAGWAPSVHYLVVRLRRGQIRGRKVGRSWRMSDDDVRAYADTIANDVTPQDDAPRFGVTAMSARRRIA